MKNSEDLTARASVESPLPARASAESGLPLLPASAADSRLPVSENAAVGARFGLKDLVNDDENDDAEDDDDNVVDLISQLRRRMSKR